MENIKTFFFINIFALLVQNHLFTIQKFKHIWQFFKLTCQIHLVTKPDISSDYAYVLLQKY